MAFRARQAGRRRPRVQSPLCGSRSEPERTTRIAIRVRQPSSRARRSQGCATSAANSSACGSPRAATTSRATSASSRAVATPDRPRRSGGRQAARPHRHRRLSAPPKPWPAAGRLLGRSAKDERLQLPLTSEQGLLTRPLVPERHLKPLLEGTDAHPRTVFKALERQLRDTGMTEPGDPVQHRVALQPSRRARRSSRLASLDVACGLHARPACGPREKTRLESVPQSGCRRVRWQCDARGVVDRRRRTAHREVQYHEPVV